MVYARDLPYEQRVVLYNNVIKLREKGLSYREISIKTGLPKSTVALWLEGRCKPNIRYKEPNLSPSSELSYLIGAYHADGTSHPKKYKIMFRVRDRDFAEEISKSIDHIFGWKKSKIGLFKQKYRGREIVFYQIQVYSKQLYELLTNFNKCIPIVEKYPADFVRGFADGDGSVYCGKYQKSIEITNTDISLLRYVSQLLERIGIYSKIYGPYRNRYYLHIDRYKDIVEYYRLIGFSINRKEKTLSRIVKRYEGGFAAKTAER